MIAEEISFSSLHSPYMPYRFSFNYFEISILNSVRTQYFFFSSSNYPPFLGSNFVVKLFFVISISPCFLFA